MVYRDRPIQTGILKTNEERWRTPTWLGKLKRNLLCSRSVHQTISGTSSWTVVGTRSDHRTHAELERWRNVRTIRRYLSNKCDRFSAEMLRPIATILTDSEHISIFNLLVCSGSAVVTACDFESGRPGSNPEWGPIYYEASIPAQGLPEPSSLRGSTLDTRAVEHKGCNWGMQVDWWLQPRAMFGHTFSDIIWHMPQKQNQFNCMTLSWWPHHEIVSVTLQHISIFLNYSVAGLFAVFHITCDCKSCVFITSINKVNFNFYCIEFILNFSYYIIFTIIIIIIIVLTSILFHN